MKRLRQACERVRRLGYSIDDEEEELGVRCIGAPVFNWKRDTVAAISVSGPVAQLENIPPLAARVRETALAISRHLGLMEEEGPQGES
jgi:DNA-binding IclR family transcriptional regulator